MLASGVKNFCTNIVGVINNFPNTNDCIDEKSVQPKFFKRQSKNLIIDGEPIIIPMGHTGLKAEVHFGVIVKEEVMFITRKNALDFVDGYVAVLNNRICDTPYSSQKKSIAITHEFPTDVAISTVVPKNSIQHPNICAIFNAVNDQEIQRAPLTEMLLSVEDILVRANQYVPLTKGDIVLCGTPIGSKKVEAGDVLEIGIDGYVRSQFRVEKAADIVSANTKTLNSFT